MVDSVECYHLVQSFIDHFMLQFISSVSGYDLTPTSWVWGATAHGGINDWGLPKPVEVGGYECWVQASLRLAVCLVPYHWFVPLSVLLIVVYHPLSQSCVLPIPVTGTAIRSWWWSFLSEVSPHRWTRRAQNRRHSKVAQLRALDMSWRVCNLCVSELLWIS